MSFTFGQSTTTTASSAFGTNTLSGGNLFGGGGDQKAFQSPSNTENKGGLFGSPTGAPAFSSFSFGAKTTSSTPGFFSTPTTTTASSAFGASKPLAFGGFTSPPNQTVGSPGFGKLPTQNAPQNLSFGQTPNTQQQATPAFGTQTTQATSFGSPASSGFGLAKPNNQQTSSGFSFTPTSGFSVAPQQTATTTTQQQQQSSFSITPVTTSSFGQSTPSFGQMFGKPSFSFASKTSSGTSVANTTSAAPAFGATTAPAFGLGQSNFGQGQQQTSQSGQLAMQPLSQPSQLSIQPASQPSQSSQLTIQPASQPSQLTIQPASQSSQLASQPASQQSQLASQPSQAQAKPGFGQPITQTSQPAPSFGGFGQSKPLPSYTGSPAATSAFGVPTTSSSVPTTVSSAFSVPTTSAFNVPTTSAFSVPATSSGTFGVPATSSGTFGVPTTSSAFGVGVTASTAAGQTSTAQGFTATSAAFSKPAATTAATATSAPTGMLSLGKSTAASTMPTLTTATITTAAAPPQPISSITFAQLEENINKWTLELEEQEKIFINQATQINAWDRLLISNGEMIVELNDTIQTVKNEQQSLEHELDFVLAQQKELEEILTPIEKQLLNETGDRLRDPEREHMYSLAENLDSQLRQMSEDLKEVIEHLNETNRSQDTNDPIVQIGRILNAHMSSMQWIDNSIAQISTKLDQLKTTHDTLRRDNERSFQLTYN